MPCSLSGHILWVQSLFNTISIQAQNLALSWEKYFFRYTIDVINRLCWKCWGSQGWSPITYCTADSLEVLIVHSCPPLLWLATHLWWFPLMAPTLPLPSLYLLSLTFSSCPHVFLLPSLPLDLFSHCHLSKVRNKFLSLPHTERLGEAGGSTFLLLYQTFSSKKSTSLPQRNSSSRC